MDRFKALQLETYHGCNLNCKSCPNSLIEKHGELMPWATIKELIKQLKEINYGGRISPYLMNEPTCDKRLPEIIAYIRQEMPDNLIMIGTNGVAIGPNDLIKLFDAGLNDCVITCYSKNTWDKFKCMEGQKTRFIKIFEKNKEFEFFNRGGSIKLGENHKIVHETCAKGVKQAFVNYKGDVILCCSDYYFKVIYGNILQDGNILDIFNCEKGGFYREKLRNRDRKDLLLCEQCNVNRPQQRLKKNTV